MASFASSATTDGARKHAWTKIYDNSLSENGQHTCKRQHGSRLDHKLLQYQHLALFEYIQVSL